MENVVDVGGDDQPFNRQAHLRRDIAGEDVAEIAGRHAESHFAVRRAQLQRGGEVIDHLRAQPCPVDRIDSSNMMALFERVIIADCFYNVLAIIEYPLNCNVIDIFIL